MYLPSSLRQDMAFSSSKEFVCVCNQGAYVDDLTDGVDRPLILLILLKEHFNPTKKELVITIAAIQ